MECPKRGSQWSHGEQIISEVYRRLAFEEARVRCRRRDPEAIEARQLARYVLAHGGYRLTHIGALLLPTHGTITHALHRAEQKPALCRAEQRLAQEMLPFVGPDEPVQPAGSVPINALSRSLVHALPEVASPQGVRTVGAVVEEVLDTWRLSTHLQVIEFQLRQAGLR
jgi:hypothetical protein